jgi:hypothetical protein
VKRIARILCAAGLITILCFCISFYAFEHIPSPWGVGTLSGGLSAVGEESSIDQAMRWQLDEIGTLFGMGIAGILLLLAGCGTFLVAWIKSSKDNRAAGI